MASFAQEPKEVGKSLEPLISFAMKVLEKERMASGRVSGFGGVGIEKSRNFVLFFYVFFF